MSGERRLPVFLVLDVSASMVGEPIEAVRQGLNALMADLRDDPHAFETAWLSVITFSNEAKQITPLTPVFKFRTPQLVAGGQTSLGAALTLVSNAIEGEAPSGLPDWKPLVFVMTDGAPTDPWQEPAERLKTLLGDSVVACAAGTDADRSVLDVLAPTVIELSRLRPDDMRAFFQWVSTEIKDAVQPTVRVPGTA